jgi:phosphate-selective porin OprO and OprP
MATPWRVIAIVALFMAAFASFGVMEVGAKSTVEEILDILHQRGELSSEEYERLLAKAREERIGEGERGKLSVTWDDGLEIADPEGKISITFGGRIQNDWGVIAADEALDVLERGDSLEGFGTEIRRLGLFMGGTVYEWGEFGIGVELSGGDIFIEDAWVGVSDVLWPGFIRIGHQKEPFSLEELTSDRFTTFMERGLPNVFVPSWNTGLHLAGTALGERMTWAAGVFEETDSSGSSDPFDDVASLNLTGRLTGLPWRAGEDRLLHLGLGYSRQFRDENEPDAEIEYAARPESHLTDVTLVDTGLHSADDVDLLGLEAALVLGRISIQSEYLVVAINRSGENPVLHGFYAYISYFLTGESRNYDASRGRFARTRPIERFDPSRGGWGAWEIAARYSFLDLEDVGIDGGEQRNVTLALNWYPYAMFRVMLNYIHAEIDRTFEGVDLDGRSVGILQLRFQADL